MTKVNIFYFSYYFRPVRSSASLPFLFSLQPIFYSTSISVTCTGIPWKALYKIVTSANNRLFSNDNKSNFFRLNCPFLNLQLFNAFFWWKGTILKSCILNWIIQEHSREFGETCDHHNQSQHFDERLVRGGGRVRKKARDISHRF